MHLSDYDLVAPFIKSYLGALRKDTNNVYHDDLLNVSYQVRNGRLEVIDKHHQGGN